MGNCNLEIQVHNIFYKLGSDQIKTVQKNVNICVVHEQETTSKGKTLSKQNSKSH